MPEAFRNLVGQRIRQARKEVGLTLEEAAERIGVVRQAVVFWEAGKSYPTIENLKRLASVYGVSIAWLLLEDQVPASNRLESALRVAREELPAEDVKTITDLISFLRSRRRRQQTAKSPP